MVERGHLRPAPWTRADLNYQRCKMDWKSAANEAIKQGYPKGNPWERAFHKHLLQNSPALAQEFQAERCLEAFLVVRTSEAMDRANQLEAQGTDPQIARELALAELLEAPPPPAVTQWEQEGAEQDVISAVEKHLQNLSQSRPAPKTPPT